MGNKFSLNPQIPSVNIDQWEIVSHIPQKNYLHGQYTVFKNKANHQLIQEYKLVFVDEDDFNTYLQSFTWRLKQPKIVRTLYLVEEHKEQLCSITYAAKVYIEHITIRLSNIKDIPFPQNLYVGICMLEGYGKLYEHITEFQIQESQVCIDANGYVKIWINSDLSKNYPYYSEEGLQYGLEDIIEDIFRIICVNTDPLTEPYPLSRYFSQNRGTVSDFQDGKMLIYQYAKQYNTKIPHRFASIPQILDKKKFKIQQKSSEKQQWQSEYNKQMINSQKKKDKQKTKSNTTRVVKLKSSLLSGFASNYPKQYSNPKQNPQNFNINQIYHKKNISQFSNHSHKQQHFTRFQQKDSNYISKPNFQIKNYNIPYQQYDFSRTPNMYKYPHIRLQSQNFTYSTSNIKRCLKNGMAFSDTYIQPTYKNCMIRTSQFAYQPLQILRQKFQSKMLTPVKRIVDQNQTKKHEIKDTLNIALKKEDKKQLLGLSTLLQTQAITPLYDHSKQSYILNKSQIIKQQKKIIEQQKQQLRKLKQALSKQNEINKRKHIYICKAQLTNTMMEKPHIKSSINSKNMSKNQTLQYDQFSEKLDSQILADMLEIQQAQANI